MNNSKILDKKNLMKRKRNSATNKSPLTVVLCAMVFTMAFTAIGENISGIGSQNNPQNPTIASDNASDESKYCSAYNCDTICNDLRHAFANGNGEKIKTITETYSGSGEYCGY